MPLGQKAAKLIKTIPGNFNINGAPYAARTLTLDEAAVMERLDCRCDAPICNPQAPRQTRPQTNQGDHSAPAAGQIGEDEILDYADSFWFWF